MKVGLSNSFQKLFFSLALLSIGKHLHSQENTEFWSNTGFSYLIGQKSLIDAGLRIYLTANDGQAAMSFWGFNAGTRVSLNSNSSLKYSPYLGLIGHVFPIAYGMKIEYQINQRRNNLALTPEFGLSIADLLRLTMEYRQNLVHNLEISTDNICINLSLGIPITSLKIKNLE